MAKEMNAKEAFEILQEDRGAIYDDEWNAIETALNRLDELEKTNIVLTHQLDHERKIRIRQEKKLKALEIIKEKDVHISCIKICRNYISYNDERFCRTPLTETEFNLLKEWLK